MNILGINGSPRIGGNTDILLDRALDGARSLGAKAEKVILNKLKFSPCQECENIKDDGSCIIEDDMQRLYKKIEEADGVIIASPVFFGSVSAQTKTMVDRFQCAWRAKNIFNKEVFKNTKAGAFISVEASDRKDFFENSKLIVKNLFATINALYKYELFCSGLERKGDVFKRPDCLERAYKLGQKIAKQGVK
jgi:multimeric flavodoxin WrbA